jgi:3'-phosphoadenosine 5'-phosphosulfate (PAPS) 3'-phosphatase
VVEAAGGSVTDLEGKPLRYNKADILNPWFLAAGDPTYDWRALLDRADAGG